MILARLPTRDVECAFIYRISWFETKKHIISHTDMYYLNPEDTYWAFEGDWDDEVFRVEYICVSKDSKEYESAVNNSTRK